MIKAAIRNPVAVLMFSIGLVLMGGVALQRLPVDLFPKLSVPVIIVGTSFRGAAPETVEQSVTFPVEQAVAQAWNIETVTSTTRQGLSIVFAWFHWGSDIDAALLDMVADGTLETYSLKYFPFAIHPENWEGVGQ